MAHAIGIDLLEFLEGDIGFSGQRGKGDVGISGIGEHGQEGLEACVIGFFDDEFEGLHIDMIGKSANGIIFGGDTGDFPTVVVLGFIVGVDALLIFALIGHRATLRFVRTRKSLEYCHRRTRHGSRRRGDR